MRIAEIFVKIWSLEDVSGRDVLLCVKGGGGLIYEMV